jgi:hypothetical protein
MVAFVITQQYQRFYQDGENDNSKIKFNHFINLYSPLSFYSFETLFKLSLLCESINLIMSKF